MISKQIYKILPNSNQICFVVPSLFSSQECQRLLAQNTSVGFKKAIDNYPTYYRNNERLIIHNKLIAEQLFNKIKEYLPETIKIQQNINTKQNGVWKLSHLNERLRFCRYGPLQYFNRHLDGVHHNGTSFQSKLTFMVYLNSAVNNFEGGRTLFYENNMSKEILAAYTPQQGDLIIFDHNIWHEGQMLRCGQKFVMRSDIVYKKVQQIKPQQQQNKIKNDMKFCEGHQGYIWGLLPWNDMYLISGGRDKIIKIWGKSGELFQKLQGHQNSVLDLIKLNQNTLISCSRDRNIILWKCVDNHKFSLYKRYKVSDATVLTLLKLSDDQFAIAGADSMIRIFSARQGKQIKRLEGHDNWVWKIANINDNMIASCSQDKTIRIWNWKECKQLIKIEHLISLYSMAYNEKTNVLLVGDYEGNVFCFSFESNKWTHNFKAHNILIRCICIISETLFGTGSQDGWVRVGNFKMVVLNACTLTSMKILCRICAPPINIYQVALMMGKLQKLRKINFQNEIAISNNSN